MTEALVITGGSRGTLASAMPPKAQPNPCGIPAVGNAEGTSGSYPRRMSGHRNNQPTTERELLSKNGEQKPAAKRRRVSKACDRCHQGKLKCNGALPRCGTCAKGNKTCSYASGMKRRGLRTGYVRALEGLWGLIFQSVEGSEELVESLVESTRKNGFWTQEESDCGWSDGETPWARWKSSSIPQAIDDILCNTSDRAKNTPTEPLKLTAKWGPFDPLYPVTKPMIHQGVEAVCHKCAQRSQSQANAMNPAIPGHVFQYSVPELPSKPVQILNRYFALTHSWLPIVDRHAMYRSLFLFKQLPANSGEIAALWALLAHASMTLNASGKHQRQAHEPDICYMAARRAIPIEREDRYSVGHIQALLILALSHYAALECKVARTVVAQAILLARHIGLDEPRNCEQDTHLRTWLACFVIDTLIAMHTRSAPHMRSEDVKHHPPIEETANEEWEPWDLESVLLPGGVVAIPEIAAPTHSLSVFSRLVDLMCIANDCASSTTDEDRQQPMNALLSWTRSLPDHIRSIGDSVAPTTCWPPNVLNLYTIHAVIRRSICPFSSPEMKGELKSGYYWQMVADGMDSILDRFEEEVLPTSFNLLRSITQEPDSGRIQDLVPAVREKYCGEMKPDHERPTTPPITPVTPRVHHQQVNGLSNAPDPHTSSRTLGTLLNHGWPWPTGATSLLVETMTQNSTQSLEPEQPSLSTSEMAFVDELLGETALEYLNDWSEIEMQV